MITAERIEWYDSATLSAAKGEIAQVGDNIHTDEACARNQGLPGTIADGMISTNWCSSMMIAHFGMDHVVRGELRIKFIKPILIGATVSVKARVLAAERRQNGGTEYQLDVWCEVEDGTKVVDGGARVVVAAGAAGLAGLSPAAIFVREVAPGRAPLTAHFGCDVGLDDHSVAQPFRPHLRTGSVTAAATF